MEKLGTIYKITSPSGKVYIGQTIQDYKVRLNQHKSNAFNNKSKSYNLPLSYAIRKYSWSNFNTEVLEHNISVNNLNEREEYYQLKFNSLNKNNGYNILLGSPNKVNSKRNSPTKETRQKISKKLTGHIPWNKGITMSQQHRDKCRKASTGVVHSKKTCDLIRLHSKKCKHVACYTKDKLLVKVYYSCKEATRMDNIEQRRISECIRNKRVSYKGLYWKEISLEVYNKYAEQSKLVSLSEKVKNFDNLLDNKHILRCYNLNNELIKLYKSITSASKELNIPRKKISKCIKNNISISGYIFKYI